MENVFGKNLHFLRTKKSLTLSEMAKNTGFSSSQWNNYELGSSYPKFLDLVKISKYFDIPETELIHINLELIPIDQNNEGEKLNLQLNEGQESYNINYKDLAESRKETIDCLRKEITYLEEKIALLSNKRKAG